MTIRISHENYPETVLADLGKGDSAVFRCNLTQWYLPGKPSLELLVVALADNADHPANQGAEQPALKLVVTQHPSEAEQVLAGLDITGEGLNIEMLPGLAATWEVPVIDLAGPLVLEPVAIPKPWGQEIWYTGMEQRGLSQVTDGRHSIPLAWLIAVFPTFLMGVTNKDKSDPKGDMVEPNLLKILDPLPEPVYGDLYFELHEEKREVYVVTHIDKQAWPEGVGAIRYGFSALARGRYQSESAFRSAYLEAVSAYRELRKQIDADIDKMRLRDGVGLNEAVSAEQAKRWQRELPSELIAEEASVREEMDGFTELRPLSLGDVVKVPLLTPHALQHGVRTVEFQTPVYERKILSFAQKVLTQDNWDTAEAMELMPMGLEQDIESRQASESISNNRLIDFEGKAGVSCEQVVVFEDFQVLRITFQPGAEWVLPSNGTYSLVMTTQGVLSLTGQQIRHEQAVFVPASCGDIDMQNIASGSCVALISQPRSEIVKPIK
jgi:mannose-6-phosphate isomerase class I